MVVDKLYFGDIVIISFLYLSHTCMDPHPPLLAREEPVTSVELQSHHIHRFLRDRATLNSCLHRHALRILKYFLTEHHAHAADLIISLGRIWIERHDRVLRVRPPGMVDGGSHHVSVLESDVHEFEAIASLDIENRGVNGGIGFDIP